MLIKLKLKFNKEAVLVLFMSTAVYQHLSFNRISLVMQKEWPPFHNTTYCELNSVSGFCHLFHEITD